MAVVTVIFYNFCDSYCQYCAKDNIRINYNNAGAHLFGWQAELSWKIYFRWWS